METRKGARCLGLEGIGSIEKGMKADIITLDLTQNLLPINDLISNIVYSSQGFNVNDVIIDGKVILQNKEF